jgi:hypothetical protein
MHAAPPHLFHAAHPFQTTLMGLPALCVVKPQLFYELPAHEGVRCIFVNH